MKSLNIVGFGIFPGSPTSTPAVKSSKDGFFFGLTPEQDWNKKIKMKSWLKYFTNKPLHELKHL